MERARHAVPGGTDTAAPSGVVDRLPLAADALRAAFATADLDALHREMSSLRSWLVEQLHSPDRDCSGDAEPAELVARRGRQAVLAVLNELFFGPTDGGVCECLVRATEVEALLREQAVLELSRHRTAH